MDKLKIHSITKAIESTSESNIVSKILTDAITMLEEHEIKFFKEELLKIKSLYSIELNFFALNLEDIFNLVDFERKSLGEINKNRVFDTINTIFKHSKEIIPNELRELTKETSLNEALNIDTENVMNMLKDERGKESRKEMVEVSLADFIIETCTKEKLELETVLAYLLTLCDIDKLEERAKEIFELKNNFEEKAEKEMEESFLNSLSREDLLKVAKGTASVKKACIHENAIPPHLSEEFKTLMNNSFDQKTNTVRVDVTKYSKELIDFLKNSSLPIL